MQLTRKEITIIAGALELETKRRFLLVTADWKGILDTKDLTDDAGCCLELAHKLVRLLSYSNQGAYDPCYLLDTVANFRERS